MLYHLEFLNAWDLLWRKVGKSNAFKFFNRRSRSCAIKNKSGVADCSSLQPFKQFVSWLPSKLTPGSFFWNGTSLRTACLSRQLGSQLPSLDASRVCLFCSHPWPYWSVSFFGWAPLRALCTGCFPHTQLSVIVSWAKVGTENGNEWEKDVCLSSQRVIYARGYVACGTYKNFLF